MASPAASFTIVNYTVKDVSAAAGELTGRGWVLPALREDARDADGVMRANGPDIAWFTDPAGNFLSVVAQGRPLSRADRAAQAAHAGRWTCGYVSAVSCSVTCSWVCA